MTNEEQKNTILEIQLSKLEHSPKLELNQMERLPLSILNEHFGNYSQCESFWTSDSVTYKNIKAIYTRLRTINTQLRPNEYYPYYEENIFTNNLLLGKAITDMYFAYRIKTNYPKCPLCGNSIFPHTSTLSRRHSDINICSTCGEKEAMEDWANIRE